MLNILLIVHNYLTLIKLILLASNQGRHNKDQESEAFYEGSLNKSASQPTINPIILSTPESQVVTMQTMSPYKAHPLSEIAKKRKNMDTGGLPGSACALNLGEILSKTMDETSEMLRLLEEEDHTST